MRYARIVDTDGKFKSKSQGLFSGFLKAEGRNMSFISKVLGTFKMGSAREMEQTNMVKLYIISYF